MWVCLIHIKYEGCSFLTDSLLKGGTKYQIFIEINKFHKQTRENQSKYLYFAVLAKFIGLIQRHNDF